MRMLLAALVLLVTGPVEAGTDPLPLSAFLAPDAFESVKISPDGGHFAASVPMEDRTGLVVLRASDMKQTAFITFEREAYVSSFQWVNPRQIVYTVATKRGSLAVPIENGYLYQVNADGSETRPVSRDPLWLADTLPAEDDVILVGHDGDRGDAPGLSRLDLRTGKISRNRIRSPLSPDGFFADNAGELRLVSGTLAHEVVPRLYQRVGEEWIPVNVEAGGDAPVFVTGFSADNRYAYLMGEEIEGVDGFYELDLQTRARRLLLRDERVDASSVLSSPTDGGVIAVRYYDGKPKLRYLDPENRFARELRKIEKAFPDAEVHPTSYTSDGGKGVYRVTSDVNSGDFYLVDHVSGKAHFIAATNEALDPRLMSPMQPFRFAARDGLELEGFLTTPANWERKGPGPLVVVPHGGPIGIYDRWGFDREAQLLASRGYAVLQVNFRGSGNYGKDFRERGHHQWGGKMIDDIVDATRWAIDQGVAERGRICIYGASYGAYAAMMGLAREPELYACGIGNVGVYDLAFLYRSETVNNRPMQEFLDLTMGHRGLDDISPNRLASRIRVPVLLAAGERDGIAPVEHTRAMHKALQQAGVPVEMVVYPGEAHGNYLEKNRRDWAERVLAMLDRRIGRRETAPASP